MIDLRRGVLEEFAEAQRKGRRWALPSTSWWWAPDRERLDPPLTTHAELELARVEAERWQRALEPLAQSRAERRRERRAELERRRELALERRRRAAQLRREAYMAAQAEQVLARLAPVPALHFQLEMLLRRRA